MAREMKDSGVEWIGEIPADWGITRVKHLFIIGRGRVIATTELIEKGYPVYSSQTKNDGLLGYIETFDFDRSQLTWTTDGANAGTVFLREGKHNCTNVCGTLMPRNDSFYLRYMYYALSFIAYYHKRADINGFKIMNNEMADIELILPPREEQSRIVAFIDEKCSQINHAIDQTRASIEEYKKLKQAVITQAVTKGIRPDRQMKDSGIEWIGAIPFDWSVSRVKNVSLLVTDGAHVSPETEEGIYDFVSTVNLCDDGIDFDNCLKTSDKSYKYLVSTGCKPQIGDVLISKDGTVGKTVIVKHEREFVVASSLVIVRPDQSKISSEFLNYALQSNVVQKMLELLMHGAGLKRVSVAKNANLVIFVPKLDEQGEIVEYLGKKCKEIDYLIQKKKSILLELEAYKKSLIYEYVTGKKEVPA